MNSAWMNLSDRIKERLDRDCILIYPVLISFAFVLILLSHVLVGLNPKMGNLAVGMSFEAEDSNEDSIWLNVFTKKNKLVVTTGDKKVFFIDPSSNSANDLQGIIDYLKDKTIELSLYASLEKRINFNQSLVILSVDEQLKYMHLKPLLYALAKAGISDYGFEFRKPIPVNSP